VNQKHTQNGRRVGVVLFQLGGPDSLAAVEPFLYNLFCDPDIIDFPFARLGREPLARLIASRRAKRVWKHYQEIGGKSPLRELTEAQARALERELRKSLAAQVFVAMRYWHPFTEEVVGAVQAQDFDELVLLPLYPQYSRTTTGSSLNEWHRRFPPALAKTLPLRVIRDFHDHPLYLAALVERIQAGLERFRRSNGSALRTPEDVHLLFSAHGVPESVVQSGDPYQRQVEATVERVLARGGWPNPHTLCYQSRSGPGRWLRPYLDEALHELAAAGVERLLVIPISFVSDHVETLHELDIEARELAQLLGIEHFAVMPALNDSSTFIAALADLILRELERPPARAGGVASTP
jgi:ferrochelatase